MYHRVSNKSDTLSQVLSNLLTKKCFTLSLILFTIIYYISEQIRDGFLNLIETTVITQERLIKTV